MSKRPVKVARSVGASPTKLGFGDPAAQMARSVWLPGKDSHPLELGQSQSCCCYITRQKASALGHARRRHRSRARRSCSESVGCLRSQGTGAWIATAATTTSTTPGIGTSSRTS